MSAGNSNIAALPAPRKARHIAAAEDARPTIKIIAGEIERVVNEAESALIRANRGLYQRANQIVTVGHAPAIAADGKEIIILRIFERGDHALLEDLAASARFVKLDKRAKGIVAVDPPMAIVKTLQQRTGRLKFPVLSGVVNAPTMRSDGSILCVSGYDLGTGLIFNPCGVEFPPVPRRPTRSDAEVAFALLLELIEKFPFVEAYDRSVALSAILTACVRRSLPTAPMHAFTAPTAGSGKSKLVDITSVIATGHEAAVLAQGANDEELEERLASVLMAGDSIVTIDNCQRTLGGALLCQMLSQSQVKPRILGMSKTPELSTAVFVAATGNNLVLEGRSYASRCRL